MTFIYKALLRLIDKINRFNLHRTIEWITGATSINKDAMTLFSVSKIFSSTIIEAGLCDGKHWGFIQQEGTFFKRSLWDKVNKTDGFAHLKYVGDWNLWRQFAKFTDIHQFKYPLARFAVRDGQLSQTTRTEYGKEIEQIKQSHINNRDKLPKKHNLIDKIKKHSKLGTTKHSIQKTQHYKNILKLFNPSKYNR